MFIVWIIRVFHPIQCNSVAWIFYEKYFSLRDVVENTQIYQWNGEKDQIYYDFE